MLVQSTSSLLSRTGSADHLLGHGGCRTSTTYVLVLDRESLTIEASTYPLSPHLENLKSQGFTYPATLVLGSTLLILSASAYTGYRIGRRSTHQALQSANAATYRLALRQGRHLRNVPTGITALQNEIAALRSEHESLVWSVSRVPVSDVFDEVVGLREKLQGLQEAVIATSGDQSKSKQSIEALQRSVGELLEQLKSDEASKASAQKLGIRAKEEAQSVRSELMEGRSLVMEALKTLQDSVSTIADASSKPRLATAEQMYTADREQADAAADHWAASSSAEKDDVTHQDMESVDDLVPHQQEDDMVSLDSPLHASFGYHPQAGDTASTVETPKRGRPRGSKRRSKSPDVESDAEHQLPPPSDHSVAQDTTHPYDPSYEARTTLMRYRWVARCTTTDESSLTMNSLPRRLYPYQ